MNSDPASCEENAPPSAAPALPRPITLLVNVNSRQGRDQFEAARKAVRAAGIPAIVAHAVQSKEESEKLLRAEIEAGAKTIIIGGGDGTLSSCAGVLVGTGVAMAVLPMGTGNTFVRSLGVPVKLEDAAVTIAAGHVESVDVGRCNGRIFLNSVALGLSADIAAALDKDTKKRLGLLAWPVVGVRVLARHRPLRLRVLAAETKFAIRTHQIVVANGRYLAGPIAASEDASLQSHDLEVFTLGGSDWKSLLRATWKWLRGNRRGDRDTRFFKTRKLRLESLKRPLRASVDGDLNETTPLELEIMPAALRVVVPQGFIADEA